MLIIPAIDIQNGQCVRLVQGDISRKTVYYEDPLEAALLFESEGAGRLHLVDLDGAFGGRVKNLATVKRIVTGVSVPVQVGGGIRNSEDAARLLELGVDRVILGTAAVNDPALVESLCRSFPGSVAVGIDARNGWVSVRGWVENTAVRALDLGRRMQDCGVAEIIYTDISRDGTLAGPNIPALREMAKNLDIGVIASGGISGLDDIKSVCTLSSDGVTAVIVGKALYENRFTVAEALAVVREGGEH